jgi:hypothetical protein
MLGTEPLDSHRPENLEKDVGWVKTCWDDVELVAFEAETFFEAEDFGIACGFLVSMLVMLCGGGCNWTHPMKSDLNMLSRE